MNSLFWQSGAKINISDGSCPERIVTITGNLETITKAFTMICRKFEDVSTAETILLESILTFFLYCQDMTQLPNSVPKPPITFRLIVPATQCGSLIGKGGSKIKEIREVINLSAWYECAASLAVPANQRFYSTSSHAEHNLLCSAWFSGRIRSLLILEFAIFC